ncbi:MAG: leucine zipper domain-containing protein [Mycobacterium leprae]
MPHANATLTPRGRLLLAQCVVDDGWPLRRAAEHFQTSVPTAAGWAARYRARAAGSDPLEAMNDRSSRPRRGPTQVRRPVVRRILHLRRQRTWRPVRTAHRLGLHASTVHRMLRREGMPRLIQIDLATRRRLRGEVTRYERGRSGKLVPVDVTKLGRIPAGGGYRALGRERGTPNSRAASAGGAGSGPGHRLRLRAHRAPRPLAARLPAMATSARVRAGGRP